MDDQKQEAVAGPEAAREAEGGLTPLQERFVQEYLKDLNAGRAAVRAGYSDKHPAEAGYRLLHKPHVRAAVEAAKATYMAEVKADIMRAVREVEALAFSDLSAFQVSPETGEVTAPDAPESLRAIASIKRRFRNRPGGRDVEVEIRLWPKPEMLKLWWQYLGLLKEGDAARGPTVLVLKGVDGELALGLKKEGGGGDGTGEPAP